MKPPAPILFGRILIGRILIGAVVLSAVAAIAWFARGPRGQDDRVLSGYIEGEALYLSAPVSGPVSEVRVQRGQRVAAGQPLFALDAAQLLAARDAAAAAVAAARSQADDAKKGQRPAELAVYDAERLAAEAALRQARADLDRVRPLVSKGIYAPARLDQARAVYDTAAANVRAVATRRTVGTLGARPDAIVAAEANVLQANGVLLQAQSRLDQISPRAPTDARVEDTFFQTGEWAAANQPVVSLLPDSRIRLRFFVPETEISRYRVGRAVRFTCDGCAGGQKGTVSYVSSRPEFTPPIIYSRGARDRLVFMVEARLDNPRALNPGQPVDVTPLGPDPQGTGR